MRGHGWLSLLFTFSASITKPVIVLHRFIFYLEIFLSMYHVGSEWESMEEEAEAAGRKRGRGGEAASNRGANNGGYAMRPPLSSFPFHSHSFFLNLVLSVLLTTHIVSVAHFFVVVQVYYRIEELEEKHYITAPIRASSLPFT